MYKNLWNDNNGLEVEVYWNNVDILSFKYTHGEIWLFKANILMFKIYSYVPFLVKVFYLRELLLEYVIN